MQKPTSVIRDDNGTARFEGNQRSIAEREKDGKSQREVTPRKVHADWTLPGDRPDIVTMLKESNEGRLEHIVPIRYARMLKSPFTFFRGSAAIMAYDLSTTPRSGIIVQSCGDCHLSNFGLFATPERNLIFDINDFDETHPGPFEWDVKRLATSFMIACRTNRLSDKEADRVVREVTRSYRDAINRFSRMHIIDIWYQKLRIEDIIAAAKTKEIRQAEETIAEKARQRVTDHVFPKISELVNGRWRVVDQPPLIYHAPPKWRLEEEILDLFDGYARTLQPDRQFLLDRYRIEDVVIKVVGVGSVGTRCGLILMIGENEGSLLMQVKEARKSVLEPYTGKSIYEHQGRRVVEGQRLMQSASDALLGWTSTRQGNHYYLRQFRDMKFSLEVEALRFPGMMTYAGVCGWTLARAHARGGDATLISGYIGKGDVFDRAIARFASAYARQNEQDYQEMQQAREMGVIQTCDETLPSACPSPFSF